MSAGAIRAGQAYVEITARDAEAQAALQKFSARLKQIGDEATNLGIGISAVGAAIVAPLVAATVKFASLGDELDKVAGRTGATVETLSELKFAAEQSGQSLAIVEKAFTRIAKNANDAENGLTEAQRGFHALGVSIESIRGLNAEERFNKIAEAVRGIEDPMLRVEAAIQFFGARLGPQVAQLSANMRELRIEAREAGVTVSTESAAAAAKLTDEYNKLQRTIDGLSIAIGENLLPVMSPFVVLLTEGVNAASQFVRESERLTLFVGGLGVSLVGAGSALVGLGVAFKGVDFAIMSATRLSGLLGFSIGGVTASALKFIALPVGTALAGWEIGKYIAEWTGLGKAIEGVYDYLFGVTELSREEVNIKVLDDNLRRGVITLEEYQRLLKEINRLQTETPGPEEFQPSQRPSEQRQYTAQDYADAKERARFELQALKEFEQAQLNMLRDHSERALADAEMRYQRELAEAERLGANKYAIEARYNYEVARIEEDLRRQRVADEASARQEILAINDRVENARISLLEDSLQREIEAIRLRYNQELREAEITAEKRAALRAAEEAEILAAQERVNRSRIGERERFEVDVARQIADLELQAAYKGEELERKRLELARQRALVDAEAVGASAEEVNRLFDLRQSLLAGELAADQADAAGTFSAAALDQVFDSRTQDGIEDATKKTAENTRLLLNEFKNFEGNTFS